MTLIIDNRAHNPFIKIIFYWYSVVTTQGLWAFNQVTTVLETPPMSRAELCDSLIEVIHWQFKNKV